MLNGGKFTMYLQSHLWAEAANAATLLENNLITPNRTLSPFQQFFGKGKQSVLATMQKFGEMCIATFKDNSHQAKLANQGTPRIWVGYTKNHPTGTYWIFNPKTKQIILTQDVTFLRKSYSEYSKVEKPLVLNTSYEGSDDEEELETVPADNYNNNVNAFSDSKDDSSNKDFRNDEGKFLDKEINDQVITLPKPPSTQKWYQL